MRTPAKAMLCSKLAIATALVFGATPAAAQSFQGTVGPGTIGATVDQSVVGETTINVSNSQAVINWTTTGPRDADKNLTTFQASGTTAIFQGASNFAVLNRVSPAFAGDAIFMGGTINSLVSGQVGGTVYFYSPNGIVIGNNASINVGSLGLTTLPISDAAGSWMSGFGTSAPQVVFGQAVNPLSYIRTDAAIDGSINANGLGNYVALVAPRIEHSGIIRTDGGAALVGVAGATITFATSNLYNIQVTTGSDDGAGVVIDGGTIERNSQTIGGGRRAYVVAVPANDAMTMLIEGGASLGFDVAGSAGVENNVVVLSAGRNIFGGEAVGPPNVPSSLSIDHAAFTSNVEAHAVSSVTISSSGGATSFSGALDTSAGTLVDIRATANALSIGTMLNADASNVGADATGGDVVLAAHNGNTLSVGGNATLLANGNGFTAVGSGLNAGHGTGGDILIQAATGGTLNFGARLTAHADGIGGNHGFSNGIAGNGTGGRIRVLANDGNSTISVTGRTDLTADGFGGTTNLCQTCSIVGGDGQGGLVDVNGAVDEDATVETENRLTFGGRLFMTAQGMGGAGDAGAGSGWGGGSRAPGGVYLSSADGAIINVNNQLLMFADGIGGDHLGNGIAGSGYGGTAGVGSFWGPGGQINIVSGLPQAHVTAEGFGGNALLAGGQGGYAQGGYAYVDAPGAAVSVTGRLYVSAYALGGDAVSGTGGAALGGHSLVRASGANVLVSSNLDQRAEGLGGNGLVGGAAEGGTLTLHATNNATLTVNGTSLLTASGVGGSGGFGVGGIGGFGDGGQVLVTADGGGDLALYALNVVADGDGGDGEAGGAAVGGNVDVRAFAGSTIDINYQAFVNANGEGGVGYEDDGGEGEGGTITFLADGGNITVDDSLSLTAWGLGGDTEGVSSIGGLGDGGTIDVGANGGATLLVFSSFNASAVGEGGDAFALSSIGGAGIGGDVNLHASGVGSTVDSRFYLSLDASGLGGGAAGGDCVGCGGGGGDGTGGSVTMQTNGGLGNRILLGDSALLAANGQGGSGFGGAGGNGLGGDVNVTLNNNGLIDTTLSLTLSATGLGGYQYNGGVAGNGTGKNAAVTLQGVGAILDVGTDLALLAQGYGGSSSGADGGTGGIGTGGWSRIYGTAGKGEFRGTVLIDALAMGGDAQLGTGGAAISGRARLNADGADYHLYNGADIISTAQGGNGATGGSASAIASPIESSAAIFANSGGSVQIDGLATVDASSTGGSGANGGAGGDAQGGKAWVTANGSATGNGTISAATFTVSANATGGAAGDGAVGANGGTGGDGTAGLAHLLVNNSATGSNLISGAVANISANGTGGTGGRGGDGLIGGAGGAGGMGTGSFTNALGGSGNGMLTLGSLDMAALGTGGRGGDGGTAESGLGGAGGAGGTGDAGSTSFGGNSGLSTLLTSGVTTIASATTNIGSTGGDGGNGGAGAGGTGNGGDGGDALRGIATLLVRGGKVDIDAVSVSAIATGGNGGSGASAGNGGDAYTSDLDVTAASRIGDTTNGGEFDIGTLVMSTEAIGGGGASSGTAFLDGSHSLIVTDSLAKFVTYSATVGGDVILLGSDPSRIRVVNGSVSVTNGFNLSTDGELSVHLDNGTLTAGSFALSAANFVDDEDVGAPAAIGTISAGSISLLSGNDLILDANLDSGGPLSINVGGDVFVGDIDAGGQITIDALGNILTDDIGGGAAVYLFSGGATDVGSVVANGLVYGEIGGNFDSDAISGQAIDLLAGGTVSTGNLTSTSGGIGVRATGSVLLSDISSADFFFAETNVSLETGNLDISGSANIDIDGNLKTLAINAGSVDFYAGGNIDIGNADVTGWLDIEAGGSLLARNVIAGDEINLTAILSLVADNLSAGIINPSTGAVGYESNVGVLSETSVQIGNVEALGWVGIASLGTINALSIASGDDVILGADGDISITGGITTGADSRLLIVGVDTILLGEGATEEDDFDRALVFAAVDVGNVVPTGGSVTIGGPINSGLVEIFAGQNVNAGTMNVGDQVKIEAGGSLTTAAITTGHSIELSADGALSTGNLSAGFVNPSPFAEQYSVGLRSRTSIQTGTIASADFVGMASGGSIQTEAINAGGDVIALAETNASFGAISTGSESRLLIAGFDMLVGAGGYDNPDTALLFQAVDNDTGIQTGGSVTIGGLVNSPEIDLLVGGGLTTGAIAADNLHGRIGGTATLNGMWNVGATVLRSNDIAIGANGGISGFDIALLSTNATQTLIGDGLSGTGYAMSNAEFGRLEANLLSVLGTSASSAAIDTLIGDLTLSSPGMEYGFVGLGTVNPGATAPDGTVRVVGSVTGSGFGAQEILSIDADRVEVDAETATIALSGQQGQLGGILILDADQVHIAEASILDDLADDPNYTGRDQDLATPTSVERPDGVIRAAEIYVNFTGSGQQLGGVTTNATPAYSLLIQNVGTRGTPAGFVASYAEVFTSEGTPPGAIDMVVNGQLVTEDGTLTGEAARDALVEGEDLTRFTATSTINGCALSGNCIIRQEPPPIDPTPDIASQITLVGTPTSDDQPFGNEEAIEDNEEDGGEDSASSPIQPPAPLFNTKPLEVAGDTDEPVSGGGNPALVGNGVNPTDEDDDEDEENK